MRILLKAPLGPFSGWGQDGLGLTEALRRAGHEVSLLPLEVVPPLPAGVAELLTRPLVPPFDLLLAHVGPARARLLPHESVLSSRRVLWSMWEWTSFANHPDPAAVAAAVTGWDAIVAYDAVSAEAFRSVVPAGVPVLDVQGGFDPAPWPEVERDWAHPIRFLVTGHLTDRKDPLAVLRAFETLRDHWSGRSPFPAELHVKVFNRDQAFEDSSATGSTSAAMATLPRHMRELAEAFLARKRVHVHAGTWSRGRLLDLYRRMHCLVAPSRGEGKNLVALEMLSTGATVIASDIGGHSAWLDPEYGHPLRVSLRPATWPVPTTEALEAQANPEHLAELMQVVIDDPVAAAIKGRRAAAEIPLRHSWDAALSRLMDALGSMISGRPTRD